MSAKKPIPALFPIGSRVRVKPANTPFRKNRGGKCGVVSDHSRAPVEGSHLCDDGRMYAVRLDDDTSRGQWFNESELEVAP